MFDLLNWACDSLFDLYICKGKFSKWVTLRLLDLADLICVALAVCFFTESLFPLGVLGIIGAILRFVVSLKLYMRFLKERRQKQENVKEHN